VKLIPCALELEEGASEPGLDESREFKRVGVGVWPTYLLVHCTNRYRSRLGHAPKLESITLKSSSVTRPSPS